MSRLSAVLFDRDGTLVVDVPYNGDPDRVRLMPGAAAAVALARSAGLPTGVVSNQSGIGRGLLTVDQVVRVNERADELLGGLDTWVFCPHAPDAGCACRKPRPGLIHTAAARLGVPPSECLVIGDIAADVLAARAAGARGVLVPNAATAPAEVERFATESAPDPLTAVRAALTEAGLAPARRRPPHAPPARTAPAGDGMRWSRQGTAVVSEGRWSSVRDAERPEGIRPAGQGAATVTESRRPSAPGAGGSDGVRSVVSGAAASDVARSAVPGVAASDRSRSSVPGAAVPEGERSAVPGVAGPERSRSAAMDAVASDQTRPLSVSGVAGSDGLRSSTPGAVGSDRSRSSVPGAAVPEGTWSSVPGAAASNQTRPPSVPGVAGPDGSRSAVPGAVPDGTRSVVSGVAASEASPSSVSSKATPQRPRSSAPDPSAPYRSRSAVAGVGRGLRRWSA
ncbi:HAD-IIIA family hydrolase [Streptomyces sp. MC1]|uniref:D-glycero-alpha-D-manno-heptose-1,7-bisphosphate 7-phosphatase n=1 Tax=Streptomyces sp. MC1 TaxID=295105 RepID=UPI0027DEA516|nr:HAD-IIIA family hydrolase [Streptomyces sp. MC1]